MTPAEKKLVEKLKSNQEFKNEVLAYLFSTVNPDFILRWNKTGLYIRGEQLGADKIANLQNEAKLFKSTHLWKILTHTLAQDAMERMFFASKDFSDMVAGKLLLFAISTQESIINRIESIKIPKEIK